MSEPTDTPSTPESPPEAAKNEAAEGTPFALARKLVANKVPRDEALKQLRASGLDEDDAKLALNAVDGVNPSDLPDPTLSPGVNPLAPTSFALSDIGLSGNPAVVGLYWISFGAVVLVLVAVFLMLPEFGIGEASPASAFWARVGLALGATAFGWGLFRLLSTIRLRRRS